MRSLFYFMFLGLAAALGYAQQNPTSYIRLTDFKKLKDGDLVFIHSSTSRAEPIEMLTHSPLTHCGVIFLDQEGKRLVYEGAGRNAARYVTIEQWQIEESTKKGQTRPDSPLHDIFARRLKTALSKDQLDTLRKHAAELHATAYDHAFQFENKEQGTNKEYIYCSELIYRAFQKIDVELGQPRPFKSYYEQPGMTVAQVKQIMDPLLNKEEACNKRTPRGNYNPDELVISPQDVFVSAQLQDVTDQSPN